jgi:AhpD family alkylhydroperoxidase
MPRVPPATASALPESERATFERLDESGTIPGDLPRVLGHAPGVLEQILALQTALYEGELDPGLRELAVLAVAGATGARYVADRHWNYGLRAGISRARMLAVADFESSSLFDDEQRAVLRYAREATVSIKVSDATWEELRRHLDVRQVIELALVVGWYSMLARVVVPLEIETEDWYELR